MYQPIYCGDCGKKLKKREYGHSYNEWTGKLIGTKVALDCDSCGTFYVYYKCEWHKC